jgi:hypothetical protein
MARRRNDHPSIALTRVRLTEECDDLSVELGIAGQIDHPTVHEAFPCVIAACQAHGKLP